MRLVRITSPLVEGSTSVAGGAQAHLEPGIIALWHGQHLLTPAFYPKGRPLVDTFITEVSQDTWIHFPWDTALSYQPPLHGGR